MHVASNKLTTDLVQQDIVGILCPEVSGCSLVWDHQVCNAHDDIHEVMLRLFQLSDEHRSGKVKVCNCRDSDGILIVQFQPGFS